MTESELKALPNRFKIKGTVKDVRPIGEGHINHTYLVSTDERDYILQSINNTVFKNTKALMDNVVAVTEFLSKVIKWNGGDPDRETLTVIPTKDDKPYLTVEDGTPYRMYYNITDSYTLQTVEKLEDFTSSAVAFGTFQKRLSKFDASQLTETIPAFHNTKVRYFNLMRAMRENRSGRLENVAKECEFALSRISQAGIIVDAIESGEIPLRVCHNDTKLNNVLMDKATGKAICVIDLDTVMPGSMLYDFGDAIRFGASTAAEDEKDLSKVDFDLNLFEAYVKGYAEALNGDITKREAELLPLSAWMMTMECGVRFLTDYIDGDVYFGTSYPEHNLDRCRTQFKLAADMEKTRGAQAAIVEKYVKF